MARKEITMASSNNNSVQSLANVKQSLDRSLDIFGQKLKEDIFLHLALKYGITFDGSAAVQPKEIEEALFILFDRGAGIIIEEFRKNLAKLPISK
jgi:hypothetical protein